MTYRIVYTKRALNDIDYWNKSGNKKLFQKIISLLKEMSEHPTTGTGQVERLKDNLNGCWSRRIDKKNRIIYRIDDDVVIVTVISMKGHYFEK